MEQQRIARLIRLRRGIRDFVILNGVSAIDRQRAKENEDRTRSVSKTSFAISRMNLNRSVRETRRRRVFREDSARFENQIWDKKSLIIGVGDMGNSFR